MSFNTIKQNYLKLHKQAHFETSVQVFRSFSKGEQKFEKWDLQSSANLVPGDIIEIPGNQIMPCDLILLNGIKII